MKRVCLNFLLAALVGFASFGCSTKQNVKRDMIERARSDAEKAAGKIDKPPEKEGTSRRDEGRKIPETKKETKISGDVVRVSEGDVWQEGEWIVAVGECTEINISKDEAMNRALKNAEEKAISFAVGTTVSSVALMSQDTRFSSFTRYINTASYGRIVDKQKDDWKSTEVGKDENGLPILKYIVTLRCKVAKEEGVPDSDFNVNLNINKTNFKVDDKIELTITASKDCYITIFNVYKTDENVLIIFPNDYDRDNKFEADTPRIIPSENSGISFRALLPEGDEKSEELVYVIATKTPVDFSTGFEKTSVFNYLSTPTAAVTKIMERLVTIPLSERTEVDEVILIEK